MLAVERQKKILSVVKESKGVTIKELSALLGVADETIRRDLSKLEASGYILRTHGGAILAEENIEYQTNNNYASANSTASHTVQEAPFYVRETLNYEGKAYIGKIAASLINDGETVFLDSSSTSMHVARNLYAKKQITVITNAIRIVNELINMQEVNIILLGGVVRKNNLSCVSSITSDIIKNKYFANKVIFSCRGIMAHRGIMDSNEQEAEIKKAMIDCADEKILLCDSSKFDKIGFPVYSSFKEIDMVITDKMPSAEWTELFDSLDIELHYI